MSLLYKILCFVFPERCPYCGEIIKSERIACDSCMDKIERLRKPIPRGTYGFRCVSSFDYKGLIRRMILRVKYRERIQFLAQVAVILAKDINEVYADYEFDVITAVPMHIKDLKKRGYNQSELLAKELSKLLDIPYEDTLNKVKHTKKQQRCTFRERKTNLKGAFKVIDKSQISGKNILIIDDIITSGETLGACCKTISKADPRLLCCATIANADDITHRKAII